MNKISHAVMRNEVARHHSIQSKKTIDREGGVMPMESIIHRHNKTFDKQKYLLH